MSITETLTKLPDFIPEFTPTQNSHITREFLEKSGIADKLRRIPRRGWQIRGITRNVETVWNHSCEDNQYSVENLILNHQQGVSLTGVDLAHALSLARIHDIPEIIAGDATPFDDIDGPDFRHWIEPTDRKKEDKRNTERVALHEIVKGICSPQQEIIISLCNEFIDQETPLARLVRDFDILSSVMRACYYVDRGMNKEWLQAYREQVNAEVSNSYIRQLAHQAINQRLTYIVY